MRTLQRELLRQPERGKVMAGCGGLRKLRFADPSRGKGKRGGVRLIYLHIPEAHRIDLIDVYGKDEKDDLTMPERKTLALLAAAARREAVAATERKRGYSAER